MESKPNFPTNVHLVKILKYKSGTLAHVEVVLILNKSFKSF